VGDISARPHSFRRFVIGIACVAGDLHTASTTTRVDPRPPVRPAGGGGFGIEVTCTRGFVGHARQLATPFGRNPREEAEAGRCHRSFEGPVRRVGCTEGRVRAGEGREAGLRWRRRGELMGAAAGPRSAPQCRCHPISSAPGGGMNAKPRPTPDDLAARDGGGGAVAAPTAGIYLHFSRPRIRLLSRPGGAARQSNAFFAVTCMSAPWYVFPCRWDKSRRTTPRNQ